MNAIEAAKRLGISRSLLYQLIKEKRLPHRRIGAKGRRGKIIIAEEDVIAFLDSVRREAVAG